MTKLSLNDEKLKEWMDSYVKKNRFNGCSLSIADIDGNTLLDIACLLYTSPSPRDKRQSRMPSSA